MKEDILDSFISWTKGRNFSGKSGCDVQSEVQHRLKTEECMYYLIVDGMLLGTGIRDAVNGEIYQA